MIKDMPTSCLENRSLLWFLFLSLALVAVRSRAEDDLSPLLQRRWFEGRTAHFNVYSCGETQQVSRLVARLEQFRQAYSLLADSLPPVS